MSNEVLTWDFVLVKFENLVKYAAKQVSETSNMEGYIEVQDLYQEGMIILYKCWEKYHSKTLPEFKAVFSSSLFRHLRKKAKRTEIIQIDLEEVYDLGYDENRVEDMYIEYGMTQLEDMLKDDIIALAILNELKDPSNRTIWEMNMDLARKSTVKFQGQKVNIPQNTKVKMVYIRRALDLTQKQFDEAISRLREVAKQIFAEENLSMAF